MSKPLKIVGFVAGAVAVVATAGAALGLGLAVGGSVIGAGSIATYASLAAAAANMGGSLLQKPPPARGSVSQILIAPDAPQPYMMGEGYFAGVLRHDTAYGATLNKVPNPYRFMAVVYSGGGPIESITPWVDKAAVSSWYSGYLYTSTGLGAVPASAVTPQWGTAPGWSSASKLSGQAAIGWSLKFDKDGKRFASGVPQLGAYGKWVKVYDPRLDSTFPGGSGAHRIDDETTFEWSENPALHAGTYAYGRYQNGKRLIGVGLPADGIDWSCIAAWANVCESNSWSIFGVIYEPGNRWANLKDIAAAGGAMPVASSGGRLSFKYSAPQVALDTITYADLADANVQITAQQSWGERINTIIPRYTSADHDWQQVAAGAVSVPTYVTEDGEEKVREWPFNLVKDGAQAAQLAAYQLVDARELTPIVIPCLPRLRHYRPGECLDIDLPDYGLTTPAIILQRQFDPVSMTVTLTLIGETAAKHAYALGQTATPPPTPALGQTGEERDALAAAATLPPGYDQTLIATSSQGLVTITGTDTTLTVGNHDRIYSDKTVSITGTTFTGLTPSTTGTGGTIQAYYFYYDDPSRTGGAVTWQITQDFFVAQNTAANPGRHYAGYGFTDVPGGTGTTGGGSLPPGAGGGDPYDPVMDFPEV